MLISPEANNFSAFFLVKLGKGVDQLQSQDFLKQYFFSVDLKS